MRIVLMRHGRPLLDKTGWIAPADLERWIERYNRAEVASDGVPDECWQQVGSAAFIVASTATRALSSLHVLGYTASMTDAIFREAELPFARWRFPLLAPSLWAAYFRILWFFGYSRNAESIQAARVRARAAAHELIAFAERGPVLLMGHGIMNRLIAQELAALGWSAPAKPSSDHWGISVHRSPSHPPTGIWP